jgi:Zn2+/Cd2+-exporting ATPase
MDCAEEVAVLKREVGLVVDGADNLTFDVVNGRMTVSAPDATADAVREAVGCMGCG